MIAREMRMHRNYDVVIAGGRAFNPFYCASFDIESDILYNVGLPRMDKLREGQDEARRQFYETYPGLRGKRSFCTPQPSARGRRSTPRRLSMRSISTAARCSL